MARWAGILVAVMVVGLVAWTVSLMPLYGQAPPVVTVGQSYVVVVDCLPIGCYSEAFRIDRMRDGWWTVTDVQDGRVWTVNSARIYAIRPYTDADRQRQDQRQHHLQPRPDPSTQAGI